jgi:hypothetical protein
MRLAMLILRQCPSVQPKHRRTKRWTTILTRAGRAALFGFDFSVRFHDFLGLGLGLVISSFGLYPQSLSGKFSHLFRVHGKSALKGCPCVNHLQSGDRTLERFGFIDKSSVFDTRCMDGKWLWLFLGHNQTVVS